MSSQKPSWIMTLGGLLAVVGLIYGSAYGGMLLLRGKGAVDKFKDRWESGESLNVPDGVLNSPKNPIPPTNAKWDSIEALIAEAPDIELVPTKIEIDGEPCTIQLPADATFENDSGLEIALTPNVTMKLWSGDWEWEDQPKEIANGFLSSAKQIIFNRDSILVFETDDEAGKNFNARANASIGYRDYRVFLQDGDDDYNTANTLEEILLAIKCLTTLQIDEPPPTETIAVFDYYRVDYEPADAKSPAEIKQLQFPRRATTSLFALIEECPNVVTVSVPNSGYHKSHYKRLGGLAMLRNLWLEDGYADQPEHVQMIGGIDSLESLKISTGKANTSPLGKLTSLQRLDLEVDAENDQALSGLATLTNLEDLRFKDSSFTNTSQVALEPISKLTNLKRLSVSGSFSEQAVTPLANLKKLNTLFIHQTFNKVEPRIGDATLKWVGALSELKAFALLGNTTEDQRLPVTNAGIAELSKLPLEQLYLCNVAIDDNVVEHLVKMKDLKVLSLKHTDITPAGLNKLAEMSNLKTIYLENNEKVSFEDKKELANDYPSINWSSFLSLDDEEKWVKSLDE